MRILKLRTKNINSLKGENEIDFTKPHFQNKIFAITGATGAGKSTLLDAILLALYAQTTRLKDVGAFITKDCKDSFCEVSFEIKNHTYRSLFKQEYREDGGISYFMHLYRDEELISEGIPLVTQKIQDLIGLDFEQFTQSIILSQGLFDKFLKAEARERLALLEKITDTRIYATISKKVFQRTEEERLKLERIRISTENTICLEPSERREMEKKKGLLDREKKSFNLDKINYLINQKREFDTLSKRSESYKKELERLQKILSDKQTEEKEYHDALTMLSEKKRKVEQAKLFDREIEFTEKNFMILEQEIAKNENELKKVEENIDAIDRELSRLNVDKILVRRDMESFSNIKHLKQNFTLLSSKFDELNRTQEELKKLMSQNIEEVSDRPIALNIENLQKHQNELYKKIKSKNIERVEQRNLILEKQIGKLRRKEYLKKHQKQYLLDKNSLEEKMTEHKSQNLTIKEEKKRMEEVIAQLEEKKMLEEKILNYEKDRAELKEGEPCFLCGSTHHPLFSEKIEPSKTKQILDEKKKLYKELQDKFLKNEKEITKFSTDLKHIQEKITETKRELMTFHNVKGNIIELEKEQKSIAKGIEDVKYQREELETVKSKIESSKNELNRIRIQIQKNNSLKRKIAQLENRVKELSYYLIKSMRMYNIELNSQSITVLKNRLKQYEEKSKYLTKLNQQINPIEGKKIQNISKKEYIEENLNSLKKRASIQKCDFVLMKQKRFALIEDKSPEEYMAEMEKEKDEVQKRFDDYNRLRNQFNHQKSIYFSAMEELESKQKLKLIDLDAMEKQKIEMEKRIEEINQEIGAIKNQISMDDERIKKLKIEKQTLMEQERIYEQWGILNDLIGSPDGVKYQFFAQHLILSSLVSLTNNYLKRLNNRYILAIKEDTNLELEVIDSLFKSEKNRRCVKTLSGGESFIVSLALSLALLDLHSDQIEINTLFLDEGFESLDEESLKTVVSTLKELKNEGKIIGIISHVPMLKEEIKTQIKIDKIGNGLSELSVI